MTPGEDTPELVARRKHLRAEIGRNQSAVYNGIGMVGSGVICASIAFLGITTATIVGIGAAGVLVPLGVMRVIRAFRTISRSHAELESIERKPLPPARLIE